MAKFKQRQISFFYTAILLCVGMLCSGLAFAQGQPVGTVLTASGAVSAESADGEVRELSRRDAVFSGDIIATQESARVRFKLLDDSTYVLQENSIFTIEEFNYSGSEDGSEVADFYFSEGVLEFVSGYIGKQDQTKFRIDTEFAAIGLRGSGGIITTDSQSTQVFVTLGELTALNQNGNQFVLENGQTTVIDDTGAPQQQQGNQTGAAQTMTTEGNDVDDQGDNTQAEDEADNAEEEAENTEEDDQASEDQEAESTDEQGTEEVVAEEGDAEEEAEGNDTNPNEAGTADNDAGTGDDGGLADTGDQGEANAVTDANLTAVEIYAELLPDNIEPTQDDLQQALDAAIESNPVLYAELVTAAIDMGLEPPNAALTATEALGGATVSDDVITEIFFVATEGLSDTAEVEQAILNADINAALVATPTDTETVNVDAGEVGGNSTPSNNVVAPPNSASPAR